MTFSNYDFSRSRLRHCFTSNPSAAPCLGLAKEHEICNIIPCLTPANQSITEDERQASFRTKQCSQYNDVPYQVRRSIYVCFLLTSLSIFCENVSSYYFPLQWCMIVLYENVLLIEDVAVGPRYSVLLNMRKSFWANTMMSLYVWIRHRNCIKVFCTSPRRY